MDKRKYERVTIPPGAGAYLTDTSGRRLGALRVLGQGGLYCECNPEKYKVGQSLLLRIVDSSEGIDRSVNCEVRYTDNVGVGFAFEDLGPDSAVEVGVIIGKYYSAGKK